MNHFVSVEQVCVLDRLKTVVPVDWNGMMAPRLSSGPLFGEVMCDKAFTTYLVITIPEGNYQDESCTWCQNLCLPN